MWSTEPVSSIVHDDQGMISDYEANIAIKDVVTLPVYDMENIVMIEGLPEDKLCKNVQFGNFWCNISQFDVAYDAVVLSEKKKVSTIDTISEDQFSYGFKLGKSQIWFREIRDYFKGVRGYRQQFQVRIKYFIYWKVRGYRQKFQFGIKNFLYWKNKWKDMDRNNLLNRQLCVAINHNSKNSVQNCDNLRYIFHFRLFYTLNHNSKDSVQNCENEIYVYIFFQAIISQFKDSLKIVKCHKFSFRLNDRLII